jgi:hypothetical protein
MGECSARQVPRRSAAGSWRSAPAILRGRAGLAQQASDRAARLRPGNRHQRDGPDKASNRAAGRRSAGSLREPERSRAERPRRGDLLKCVHNEGGDSWRAVTIWQPRPPIVTVEMLPSRQRLGWMVRGRTVVPPDQPAVGVVTVTGDEDAFFRIRQQQVSETGRRVGNGRGSRHGRSCLRSQAKPGENGREQGEESSARERQGGPSDQISFA